MFETVTENFIRDHSDFRVQAIPNSHAADSYGWIISETFKNTPYEGRKIVISGDTRPSQNILSAARGANLLVHESTYLHKDVRTAFSHQHSTAAEAAELALQAGVAALALTHIRGKYSRQEVQAEAGVIFPGALVPAPLDTVYLDTSVDDIVKTKNR